MSSFASRRDFLRLLALLSLPLFHVRPPLLDSSGSSLSRKGPNFLIVLFDTLSARHMSLYGYNRETTPNLARFAERATVFHSHHAGGNYTTPGTASLLTGTYPWSHRALAELSEADPSFDRRNLFSLVPDSYHTVAYTHNLVAEVLLHQFHQDVDLLKYRKELALVDLPPSDKLLRNDYYAAMLGERVATSMLPGPPSTLFLSYATLKGRVEYVAALERGEYAGQYPRGLPELGDFYFRLEHAIDWITEQVPTLPQPFLAYYHLLPPHEPYRPRYDFIGIFDDSWKPPTKKEHFASDGISREVLIERRLGYDEYLAFTDAEFGRLIDALEQTGALDNTYVIVTSDHGQLMERGIHGHFTPALYQPLIHIPLLISRPELQQRQDVYTLTSCVDLLPTLLHLTGQAIPDWCEGQILPTFGGEEGSDDRTIFVVEAKSNSNFKPLTKATVAMIQGKHELIYSFGYPDHEDAYELYDLANDPEELEDLFTVRRSLAAELQAQLAEILRRVDQPYL
jgi:choline-sulfatase